jgi:hypothetical protein
MFQINQRVITREYGPGTIKTFERLDKPNAYAADEYQADEYQAGDRIGVQLDTPENWPLHAHGLPYFTPGDLI